eukprot:10243026-Heterocapsa_arctica.AAC.1
MEVFPKVEVERLLDGLPYTWAHRQDNCLGSLQLLPDLPQTFLGHGVCLDQRGGHQFCHAGFRQRQVVHEGPDPSAFFLFPDASCQWSQ